MRSGAGDAVARGQAEAAADTVPESVQLDVRQLKLGRSSAPAEFSLLIRLDLCTLRLSLHESQKNLKQHLKISLANGFRATPLQAVAVVAKSSG